MAKTLGQVGIETGNTVEAYHVTQSIDAFTGAEAYDISLSGSFNMTGSINGEPGVINPLTASYAITASYALDALSASYASSALSASHALTASYVDLVAGDNVTINQVGTSFEISASAAGSGITPAETASFVVTASATNNVITFTQGDSSTFDVTVDTGSGAYTIITSPNTGTAAAGTGESIISSIQIPANTFKEGDIVRIEVMFTKNDQNSAGYGRVYLNTSNSLVAGSPKMILGASPANYLTLTSDKRARGVTRNLLISSSNQTFYPSYSDPNVPNSEYGTNSELTFGNSSGTGFIQSTINWDGLLYFIVAGSVQTAGTTEINVRYIKISN